jgi:glycosyltransferase involved in cell wall biosynthesis
VFLTSEARRLLGDAPLRRFPWDGTSILYVSHGWDPARDGAQSITGRRLVRTLLHAGARVRVLAARQADAELEHDRYAVSVVPGPAATSGRLARATRMLRTGVPEDPGAWVADAVAAGKRLATSLPADTVIYGRASPGSSNIAAWHLARATGFPWVAHFSDEWPPASVMRGTRKWLAPYKWPLFAMWRQRILRDAGALTFSNPRQAREILGAQAERYAGKAFVVAHLPTELGRRPGPPQYETFNIVHAGNFYSGQSPAALLEGLRIFLERTPGVRSRVRLTQAGWCSGAFESLTDQHGLRDVVDLPGRLPERELLARLDGASLLVAVDYCRPDSTTVLSKLPDYLNARRPILAITAPTSSLGCLFNEDGAGLTAHYAAPQEVAERIGRIFAAWERRSLDAFLPQPAATASYDWREILAELAGAFLVARRSSTAVSRAA